MPVPGKRVMWLTLALVGGCAGGFAEGYDGILDERATAVDAKIEAFLDAMESASGSADGAYRANSQFYADARGELEALRRRANAWRRPDIVQILVELQNHVESLRKAHAGGGNAGINQVVVAEVRGVIRNGFETLYRRLALLRAG